jgi:hypothetical protein
MGNTSDPTKKADTPQTAKPPKPSPIKDLPTPEKTDAAVKGGIIPPRIQDSED